MLLRESNRFLIFLIGIALPETPGELPRYPSVKLQAVRASVHRGILLPHNVKFSQVSEAVFVVYLFSAICTSSFEQLKP